MRKLLSAVAVLAFAAAAPALAQAASITITKAGFIPSTVTIAPGESVTWTNQDTTDHQVISDKASLASPILHSQQSFTFTFDSAGDFAVTDALDAHFKGGKVVVRAAAPAPAPAPKPKPGPPAAKPKPAAPLKPPPAAAATVTLSPSALAVLFGGKVTLTGTVSSHNAGEKVTLESEPFGQDGFTKVADLTTTAGGAWSYAVGPKINTTYHVRWGGATGAQRTIGVHPAVSFHVLANGRFSARVGAARSFAGRFVQLQWRTAHGTWSTVRRARLGAHSAVVFRANLPHGTSTLRIAFSVNQAGAGYLGGSSRTIVYHRA
jgi:plastocyanin